MLKKEFFVKNTEYFTGTNWHHVEMEPVSPNKTKVKIILFTVWPKITKFIDYSFLYKYCEIEEKIPPWH